MATKKPKKKGSMIQLSKTNLIKLALIDCVTNSTVQGLPNAFKAKLNALKIFWLLLLLGSLAGCAYLISLSVIDYFEYEVTTTVRVYTEGNVPFPIVSLCHTSPITTEFGQEFIKNRLYNINEYNNGGYLNINYIISDYEQVDRLRSSAFMPNVTDEMRRRFGPSLDELIIGCMYSGRSCSESDWTHYYDFNFGNCYKFNTGFAQNGTRVPIRKVTSSVLYSGLVLYLNLNDSVRIINKAAAVSVYDQELLKAFSSDTVFLTPGYDYEVVIKKMLNFQQPKPYSNCTEDIDQDDSFDKWYYDSLKRIGYSYNRQDCLTLYTHETVLKECGCNSELISGSSQLHPTTRSCSSMNEIICVNRVYFELKGNFTRTNQIIEKYCPLECNTVTFEIRTFSSQISYGTFESIRASMFNQSDHEWLKDNLVIARIGFKDIGYSVAKEQPTMTLIQLISNIGGKLMLYYSH